MSLSSRAGFMGKTVLLWVAMTVALLGILLGALGFLTAAFLLWLEHYLSPAGALAITGVLLLLEALALWGCFSLVLRRLRARQPSSDATATGLLPLALRFVMMMVQRSPRKTMLLALIAGVLAEYFTPKDHSN